MDETSIKPLLWVASSKKDLLEMPGEVQDAMGFALPDLDKIRDRLKAAKAHAAGARP